MKISELGEFGLIDYISRMVSAAADTKTESWQELIQGISDDAAAWRGNTSIQLATVDSLVQGVHFTRDMTSWEELGWKALAINLSDIAAMGGLPRYALVSLALPGDTEVEDVASLYKGMLELSRQFGVAIVGGDTDSAPLIAITVIVIGSTGTRDSPLLTRSAARVGDRVAVTGHLGAAAAGLEMLSKGYRFGPEDVASLRHAFLKPFPRVAEGRLLVERGVRAAIDISDGLVSDLSHICRSSRVGARIKVDHVPVAPQVLANFGDRALEMALTGGEDYELLFTAPDDIVDAVKAATPCPITVIGEIVADETAKVTLLDGEGKPFSLPKGGWEHFTARPVAPGST
jgi:thiamine-monophosphate kinase